VRRRRSTTQSFARHFQWQGLFFLLLAACSDGAATDPDARPRDIARVDGTDNDSATDDALDGSGPIDANDAPADAPPDSREPCGGCGPGQLCTMGTCVDDCRSDTSVPCAIPNVCDFLTGRCVPPGMACTLTGRAVDCGSGEFPPRCGPGSVCNMAASRCDVSPECRRVVCDATNFCRGADCTLPGGGVTGLSLDAIADATAGTAMGIRVRANVTAAALCGITVTFELRRDVALYVSAYNDRGIWRIPLDGSGPAAIWVREAEPVSGVTSDRTGTLFYALQRSGVVRRVPVMGGVPTPTRFGAATTTRLARLTFGPDGMLYGCADQNVYRFAADGSIAQTWNVPGSTFFTGLVFDRDGSLLVGQHWPTVWRLAPGATAFVSYIDATPTVPAGTISPWNEGMVLGPEGRVWVGVFPSSNDAGVIYRIDPGPRPTRIAGLAELQRDVPATRYSGIHGLAFGVDGSLYFVNQNTSGNTSEAFGQVLVMRPGGRIELVAGGLNLDWPDGFDGDVVVAQEVVATRTVPADAMGHADATFDAPMRPGAYGVRALVTDPRTGAVTEARGTAQVR